MAVVGERIAQHQRTGRANLPIDFECALSVVGGLTAEKRRPYELRHSLFIFDANTPVNPAGSNAPITA